jgi:hypothetical protein
MIENLIMRKFTRHTGVHMKRWESFTENIGNTRTCCVMVFGLTLVVCAQNAVACSDTEISGKDRESVPLPVSSPAGIIVLNEIMYAPASPEPEWIELINAGSESVNVAGWQIHDLTGTPKTITDAPQQILPGNFLLLTRDIVALRTVHPEITSPVFAVSAFPSLNNGGDAVVLLDNRGLTVDSLMYAPSWGGTGGTSLERLDVFAPSTRQGNWSSSEHASGSTPGEQNSVAIADSDLALFMKDSVVASSSTPVLLPVVIRNRGRTTAAAFVVEFFDDTSGDGVGAPAEFVGNVSAESPVAPGDSAEATFVWTGAAPGRHGIVGHLLFVNDQRTANNLATCIVTLAYPAGSIVINEIMFDPLPGDAEYVELMNLSPHRVALTGWRITDRPGSSGARNSTRLAGTSIEPGEFFVLASDSSFTSRFPESRLFEISGSSLSLNNSGDAVVLLDQTGEMIDSVAYDPAWHNPDLRDATGRSLERINPYFGSNDTRNWGTCTLPRGGTPGGVNSLYSPKLHRTGRLTFSPNPFSPDGDGFEDVVVIHYELQLPVSLMSTRIYDARGRLIRRLANIEPAGPQGDLVWDGRDDNRGLARVGMYVVYLEAIDGQGGVLETVKGVVVLAARFD